MRTPLLSTRHLASDDGQTVDLVFAGLSEQSRYLRFHAPMPRLPGSVRRNLLNLDGRDRIALVAEVPGPNGPLPVGIARLGRTAPSQGEIAIAVADVWHGLGVGRRLLTELAELAGASGYTLLHAYVLPENQQVLRLLDRVFPGADRHWDGHVIQVDCPVGSSQVATVVSAGSAGPTGPRAAGFRSPHPGSRRMSAPADTRAPVA